MLHIWPIYCRALLPADAGEAVLSGKTANFSAARGDHVLAPRVDR